MVSAWGSWPCLHLCSHGGLPVTLALQHPAPFAELCCGEQRNGALWGHVPGLDGGGEAMAGTAPGFGAGLQPLCCPSSCPMQLNVGGSQALLQQCPGAGQPAGVGTSSGQRCSLPHGMASSGSNAARSFFRGFLWFGA